VCRATVDLGFLLDDSASINFERGSNFQSCIDFIVKLVSEFIISQTGTHIGLVKFSSTANLEFDFNRFSDKQSIIDQIQATKYTGGSPTNTGAALTYCKTALFAASGRKQVPRILILMTDGKADDSVTVAAKDLRNSGVVIFSLGVGKDYNIPELQEMASDPKPDHVITADFNQLGSVVQKIKNMACQGRRYITKHNNCSAIAPALIALLVHADNKTEDITKSISLK